MADWDAAFSDLPPAAGAAPVGNDWDAAFADIPGHEANPVLQEVFRPNVAGTVAKAVGVGVADAALNQLPSTIAKTVRGRVEGDTRNPGTVDRYITNSDVASKRLQGVLGPEEQKAVVVPGGGVAPDITAKDVAEGAGQLGYSAPSMAVGMAAGAASLNPAVAPLAAGATAALTGYRATLYDISKQATDAFVQKYPDATPEQITSYQGVIAPLLTEYALWEAGPEALSQAVTMGLIKAPIADKLAKAFPLLAKGGQAAKANILGKIASGVIKTGADMAEELTTETITQHGQGSVESRLDLRDKPPGWKESFDEVYPQTVAMSALQMGGGSLANSALERAKAVPTSAPPATKPEASAPVPPAVPPAAPQRPAGPIAPVVASAASTVGIDPGLAHAIIGSESGGNPNAKNPKSTAHGMGQVIDETWNATVAKYGEAYGLTNADRNDPATQALVAALVIKDTQEGLRKSLGREPSPGEVYTGYFLGERGGAKFLKNLEANPNMPALAVVGKKAADANESIFFEMEKGERVRARTLAEVQEILSKKVRRFGAGQPGTQTAQAQQSGQQLMPQPELDPEVAATITPDDIRIMQETTTEDGRITHEKMAPESQATMNAQLAALIDPNSTKEAMLVTEGSPMPANIPANVLQVQTPKGVALTANPEAAQSLQQDASIENIGRWVLGYPFGKEVGLDRTVRALDANGLVVAEVAVPATREAQAIEAMRGQSPINRVDVVPAVQALNDRQAQVRAEAAPMPQPTAPQMDLPQVGAGVQPGQAPAMPTLEAPQAPAQEMQPKEAARFATKPGKPLGDEKIMAPKWVYSWLKKVPKAVYADLPRLWKKHGEQFRNAQEVQSHIEQVFSEPHLEMEATKPEYTMLVRRLDGDKAAIVEFAAGKKQNRVVSAYTLTNGQLEAKVAKIRARGGRISAGPASPTSIKELLDRPLSQGAGTPSDVPPRSVAAEDISTQGAEIKPAAQAKEEAANAEVQTQAEAPVAPAGQQDAPGVQDKPKYSREQQDEEEISQDAQQIDATSRFLDTRIGNDLDGKPFRAGTFRSVPAAGLPGAGLARAAHRLAGSLGVRVRFWTTPDTDLRIAGFYLGDTLYIEADSPLPHLRVLGHELTHHLRKTAPDLYDDLVKMLEPYVDAAGWKREYTKEYRLFPEGRRAAAHASGLVQEEVLGNLVGDQMTRREFWDEMARQRPGLFEKVSAWIMDALDKFLGRYKNYRRGSEQAFTDLKKVREIVADVVGRYAERNRKQESVADAVDYQRVYHGSPHRGIEKNGGFSTKFMGTGEGAQAYGWGIYFAQSRDVAKTYHPRDLKLEEKLNKLYQQAERREDYETMEVLESAMLHETPDELLAKYTEEEFSKEHAAAAKQIAAFIKKNAKVGQLYEAEIPEDREMLDWDKPLSEQPEGVREKLEKAGVIKPNGELTFMYREEPQSGGQLYERLTSPLAKKLTGGEGAKAASEYLASIGIPGHRYWDGGSRNDGEGTANFVLYQGESAQIEKVHYQRVPSGDAPTFYSQMQRVLDAKLPGKGDPKMWADLVRSLAKKGEFKAEELAWSGLEDWLAAQGGRVSKEQVLDFLAANQIELKEVVKGGKPSLDPKNLPDGYSIRRLEGNGMFLARNEGGTQEAFRTRDEAFNWLNEGYQRGARPDTKFSQYQLPGGGEYREMLLTLPGKGPARQRYVVEGIGPYVVVRDTDTGRQVYDGTWGESTAWAQKQNDGTRGAGYKSSHWDEPNVLAHVRFSERTDADGKRVLHIEEVQSDWHQEGRKKGYKTKYAPGDLSLLGDTPTMWEIEAKEKGGLRQVFNIPKSKAPTAQAAMDYIVREKSYGGETPDAPFKTTWPMLAMKRMIRYAASNGFDRVAWTPGEVQAERYDLSKQISRVEYLPGSQTLRAFDLDGKGVLDKTVPQEGIADYVGKDVAERLLASEPRVTGSGKKVHSVEGDGLKIGGSGMIGFYDRILPAEVNKYIKKWGAKVGETVVGTNPEYTAEDLAAVDRKLLVEKGEGAVVHAFDITPSMREAAMAGQPLYQRVPQTETPEFKKWFGDSKVVDKDGKPLVVYHGTDTNFTRFTLRKEKSGVRTAYFSPDPDIASGYAERFIDPASPSWNETLRPQVFPVFLSLQNPYVFDAQGKGWGFANERALMAAKKGKHDGVIVKNVIDVPSSKFTGQVRDVYIVFSPAQIKSATGNFGAFDPNNPDIRYQRRPGPQTFPVSEEAVRDRIVQKIVDKFNRLKMLQKDIKASGGTIDDTTDTYLKQELFHGRTEARLNDFEREHVAPIAKRMAALKLSLKDVGDFLYASHAPKRNAVIAAKNEYFRDNNIPGSGMSDADAAQIIDGFRQAGKLGRLQEIQRMVREVNAARKDILLNEGLIDPGLLQAWEATYGDDYVPLKGLPETEAEIKAMRTGRGFDIRGQESKRAAGRESRANSEEILANVLASMEQTIIRAEKNRVGQTFLEMALMNPNPALWEVDIPHGKAHFNARTGEVTYGTDPMWRLGDNVLSVKVDGQEHYVTIHDPVLASALKNLGASSTNGLLRALAALNRFQSLMLTSLDPEFVLSNAVRDIQTAGVNLQGFDGISGKSRLVGQALRAVPGIMEALRSDNPTSQWAQLYDRYRKAGGKIGFFGLLDLEAQNKRIQRHLREAEGDPAAIAMKTGRYVADLVSDVNASVENATRLSVFKIMLDNGVSEEQAASAARNITVNFNRHGEWGPVLTSLYMFGNAGIQGTARFFQALGTSKRVQKVALGIVLAGAAMAALNRASGGDDEDGESYYDSIPEFERERNIIIMRPGTQGKYFKIPLPYGYNVLWVTGDRLGSIGQDKKSALEHSWAIAKAMLNAFNPLDTSGDLIKMALPTALKPGYELQTNRNFMDLPIWNPNQKQGEPDSYSPLRKTGEAWTTIAQVLNDISGGNQFKPGMVDLHPESIRHIWDAYTGGLGKLGARVVNLSTHFGEGGTWADAPIKDVPFLRRFAGEHQDFWTSRKYRDRSEEVKDIGSLYESMKEENPEQAKRYKTEHLQELIADEKRQALDKKLAKIRKAVKDAEDEKAPKARIDALRNQETTLQKAWLREYNEGIRDKAVEAEAYDKRERTNDILEAHRALASEIRARKKEYDELLKKDRAAAQKLYKDTKLGPDIAWMHQAEQLREQYNKLVKLEETARSAPQIDNLRQGRERILERMREATAKRQ